MKCESVNEVNEHERRSGRHQESHEDVLLPVLAAGSVHLRALPHSCMSLWHDKPSLTL